MTAKRKQTKILDSDIQLAKPSIKQIGGNKKWENIMN
ncbi:hypothetical protein IGI41_001141 [Enterococcus sp. DIV0876]